MVQESGATTQNIFIPPSLGWDAAVAITLLLAVFPVFLLSHQNKETAKSHAEFSAPVVVAGDAQSAPSDLCKL